MFWFSNNNKKKVLTIVYIKTRECDRSMSRLRLHVAEFTSCVNMQGLVVTEDHLLEAWLAHSGQSPSINVPLLFLGDNVYQKISGKRVIV